MPAGIEYFDAIGTLIGGSIVLRTSMLFALAFFIQFLIGGLSGIFVASPVLDYHAEDSYFVVGHFHYTLFAGSVFGFFAGVYHWFPKLTGARLRESLGKLQLALMVVGTNLTFLPMFFLGQDGMSRRISRYPAHPGWGTLNLLETIGAGIIALGVLIFLVNVCVSLRRRVPAGEDPWLGHTLEWATSFAPAGAQLRRARCRRSAPTRRCSTSASEAGEEGCRREGRRDPAARLGHVLLVLLALNWIWTGDAIQVGIVRLRRARRLRRRPAAVARRTARRCGAARRRRATDPETVPEASVTAIAGRPLGGVRSCSASCGRLPRLLRCRPAGALARPLGDRAALRARVALDARTGDEPPR